MWRLCTEGIRRFRRDQRKDANSSKPSVPFGQSQRRIQVSLAARDSPPSGSRSSLAILRTLIRQRYPQLRRRQCRTLACELNRITGTFGHEPSMPQAGDLSTLVKLKLRHYPVVECFPFLYSYSTSTNGNTCDLLKTFPSANQRPRRLWGSLRPKACLTPEAF